MKSKFKHTLILSAVLAFTTTRLFSGSHLLDNVPTLSTEFTR